jgi:hypothetical protein
MDRHGMAAHGKMEVPHIDLDSPTVPEVTLFCLREGLPEFSEMLSHDERKIGVLSSPPRQGKDFSVASHEFMEKEPVIL